MKSGPAPCAARLAIGLVLTCTERRACAGAEHWDAGGPCVQAPRFSGCLGGGPSARSGSVAFFSHRACAERQAGPGRWQCGQQDGNWLCSASEVCPSPSAVLSSPCDPGQVPSASRASAFAPAELPAGSHRRRVLCGHLCRRRDNGNQSAEESVTEITESKHKFR